MPIELPSTLQIARANSSVTLSLLSCWRYSTGNRGLLSSPWLAEGRKLTGAKQDFLNGGEHSLKSLRIGLSQRHPKQSLVHTAPVRSSLKANLQMALIWRSTRISILTLQHVSSGERR